MVSLYGQESVFTCSALEVKLFRLPFFFFNDTATTEIYTLSLHDALPISERGRPGKRPPHPPLVCLQLRERRPRHRPKHDVVVGQVHGEPVEAVRDRRAGRTPRLVVGPEHEVVDEELRAPSEEVCQRGAPLVGLESILLVDPNPRQLLPPPRQLLPPPRQLLLRLEQLEPRCEPLVTCPGHVLRHRSSPSFDTT